MLTEPSLVKTSKPAGEAQSASGADESMHGSPEQCTDKRLQQESKLFSINFTYPVISAIYKRIDS